MFIFLPSDIPVNNFKKKEILTNETFSASGHFEMHRKVKVFDVPLAFENLISKNLECSCWYSTWYYTTNTKHHAKVNGRLKKFLC